MNKSAARHHLGLVDAVSTDRHIVAAIEALIAENAELRQTVNDLWRLLRDHKRFSHGDYEMAETP